MSHDEHNACDAREQKLIQQNKELVEALEFYMRYYTDSRNGGIITEKIKKVLKQENGRRFRHHIKT